MSKHTPGPWRQAGEDIFGANDWWVAVATRDCTSKGSDEPEANARLIAAAPELLEALQSLVRHCESGLDFELDDAKAAIQKATGGQK